MHEIDLRSDTVTHPTPEMRHAMMEASVGDDVYGEDPGILELEAKAAKRFNKAAALFVASGTMGNLVSAMAHCGRGERMILGDLAHIHRYEAGGTAALAGIQPWTIPVQADGTLPLEGIRAGITPNDEHFPVTRMVALENTQGSVGGQPLSVEYTQQVAAICREHNLRLHIDGARIFNAAAALQTDVAKLAAPADSLTFCLSKALCAPVGSVVVGAEDFIQRARRARKQLGGGMRQAGVIAAAGIVALETMTERLHEDHAHARMLAEGLAALPYFSLEPAQVKTNMVFFELLPDAPLSPDTLSARLRQDDIRLTPLAGSMFRAVTHYWIKPEHVDYVLGRIKYYLS